MMTITMKILYINTMFSIGNESERYHLGILHCRRVRLRDLKYFNYISSLFAIYIYTMNTRNLV